MKPKIVILVKNLTVGGAEKQSVLLAKALSDSYDIRYVIFNGKYKEPKYMKLLGESPLVKVEGFEGNVVSRYFAFCSYLKKEQISIIFSYLTAANFFAITAAKYAGVKRVYTGIRNAFLPKGKAFIDKFICNNLAEKAVLNCFSGVDYFSGVGFKRDKMVVIPNCFEDITPYERKSTKKDIVSIITVGRFVEQKDYFTALNAISKLSKICSNIKYSIVGYGALEQDIRAKVSELELENVVDFYIDPNNISELLLASDIYLSTSVFEGTSNSIMEAMNANLPIVATNVGDNYKLVLEDKSGYLVGVKAVDEMVVHLKELVLNKEIREHKGFESKLHLEENYSVEKFKTSYQYLIDG